MKRKIVSDSSIDIHSFEDLAANTTYSTVPLSIRFGSVEFVDTPELNMTEMIQAMHDTQSKSASACPSPDDWINAFDDADEIFIITITSTLSGCYNSAMTARNIFLESKPDARIFILDSLSTGPEMLLLAQKLNELLKTDYDFDAICDKITQYHKTTHLLFKLDSLDNLVKNGRVGKIAATMANLLNIHIVGEANSEGSLELLHKCRGAKRTSSSILKEMASHGYNNGKVIISHCCNLAGAETLKELITNTFNPVSVHILPTGGLCSYYAELGGLLIGYEE